MYLPVVIDPEAFYDDGALYEAMGLTPAALRSARKSGELPSAHRGKRHLYRGAWVVAWLESTAEPRQAMLVPGTVPGGAR